MKSSFDDLLSRAERLNSVHLQSNSLNREQIPLGAANISDDLGNIFRSSEFLLKKKCVPANAEKMLFGEKGVLMRVAPPSLGTAATQEIALSDDLGGEESCAWVKLQAERAFLNHGLLISGSPAVRPALARKEDKESVSVPRLRISSEESTQREILFATKLRKFVKKKGDLSKLLMDAVKESKTSEDLDTAWRYMTAMYGKSIGTSEEPARTVELVERATRALENEFLEHMRERVERSRERAELGGVPTTVALISAYIQVNGSGSEEASAWQLTYYSLRAGDLASASSSISQLSHFPRSAALVSALHQLARSPKLSEDTKIKLKTEYRHESGNVCEAWQRKLYICLLGLEVVDAGSLEEWLWSRLIALRLDPSPSYALYADLQKNIAFDLGESYFMASTSSEDFLHFFTVLSLSGQPERAIKVLFDCHHCGDAVHMALLCKNSNILRQSKIAAEILSYDEKTPTVAQLNVARLVAFYTKKFELEDVRRSLDYWYFLKGMAAPTGGDVFDVAVSRAVYLSGQQAAILGERLPNGETTHALIHDYVDAEGARAVTARVASDSLLAGNSSDAINMFVLAGEVEKALEVSSDVLVSAIKSKSGLRDAVDEAKNLAYLAAEGSGSAALSAVCVLLDVVQVLSLCEEGRAIEALALLRNLNVVPVHPNSVPAAVTNFHLMSTKVRAVLPELCGRAMELAVDSARAAASPAEAAPFLRLSEALPLFVASIPYKFPTQVSAKLLQLQAHLP